MMRHSWTPSTRLSSVPGESRAHRKRPWLFRVALPCTVPECSPCCLQGTTSEDKQDSWLDPPCLSEHKIQQVGKSNATTVGWTLVQRALLEDRDFFFSPLQVFSFPEKDLNGYHPQYSFKNTFKIDEKEKPSFETKTLKHTAIKNRAEFG